MKRKVEKYLISQIFSSVISIILLAIYSTIAKIEFRLSKKR